MHADQVDTDAALVARLIAGQFPQWAHLPVTAVTSAGTDHDVYRLGDHLAVRLPVIGWATGQAALEAHWLPRLGPQLPLAVPVHVARGRADGGYPFDWSVVEWLPGASALDTPPDPDRVVDDLAGFVQALRRVDTAGAPVRVTGGRGGPHTERDDAVRRAVAELGSRVDAAAVLRVWQCAVEAPTAGEQVWVHGDLLPGNLLVVGGRLSAVIDWAGLAVGDPATDLLPAWHLLTGGHRARFLEAVGADEAARARGRGWVLSQAVVALPYYWDTNPTMVRLGLHGIAEVLADSG